MTIKQFKHLSAITAVLLLLTGCDTPQRASNESAECRQAKGFYQMCYGACLGSTPGTFLQAASACGNKCRNEALEMASACR